MRISPVHRRRGAAEDGPVEVDEEPLDWHREGLDEAGFYVVGARGLAIGLVHCGPQVLHGVLLDLGPGPFRDPGHVAAEDSLEAGKVHRANRFQLSAFARDFVEVAIVSQECFEDARFTLRTWIDTLMKPLGELQADNPAKPPTKAQKRKASEMATGGKKKKKNTSNAPPPPPAPSQVYVAPPLVPPFVPFYPQVPVAPQPSYEEGIDDVVMLRRVPPPSPFTPSLPVPPPSGIARLSQGAHSSQAMSSTQSLQPPTLPSPSQATPSSRIPIAHPYVYTQGSQVPLSMGMKCWPNPGSVSNHRCIIFSHDTDFEPRATIPQQMWGR